MATRSCRSKGRRVTGSHLLLGVLGLAGCATVGPDYVRPTLPVPETWSRGTVSTPEDLSRWWQRLGDPVLSPLVEQALKASPDLRSAQARVREARARRALAGADRFPTVALSASAGRNTTSAENSPAAARTGSGTTSELYTAGFDASWELDVFGRTRRALEAAQADLEASEADLHGTQVSLAAEVALNYVEVRAFQARLAIARRNLASQSETLQLTEWRAQAGLVGSLDVEQARANYEQTLAQIPNLGTSLTEAEHRLGILLGRAPGALRDTLAAAVPIPPVPDQVAIGIPADTLRQRPDVQAAERRLAAETARVGQAVAARYPSFTLSGSIGLEALTLGALTGGSALAWSVLGTAAATIFDAGRLRQQVEIQSAIQEQALVGYESSVLTALQDVENALVALANSGERQQALERATDAARNAALLARDRYTAGLIDFQTVLDTERTVLTIEDTLAATRAERASALIQLYKALGGGWSPETPAETKRNPS